MEHQLLQRFNGDKNTKAALLEYFDTYFKNKIVELALKKEDVKALAEAVGELHAAFDQLDITYGIKPEKITQDNQAR